MDSELREEDVVLAAEVARILISRPYAVQEDEDEEEEEEEEQEEDPEQRPKSETVDELRAQLPPDPRHITVADLNVTKRAHIRASNDEVVRSAVRAIFMLGTGASSTYAAAEAGTTTVFKGVILGETAVPPEVRNAVQRKNELMGVHNDPNDCLKIEEKRPVPVRLSAAEVGLLDDSVEFTIEDLT
jgi:hypothetical protein